MFDPTEALDLHDFTMSYRDLLRALDHVQPDSDNGALVLRVVAAVRSARVGSPDPVGLPEGVDLVFSTSPAPEGIDTDCMFLSSTDRISVHISRRAINAQVARAMRTAPHPSEPQP